MLACELPRADFDPTSPTGPIDLSSRYLILLGQISQALLNCRSNGASTQTAAPVLGFAPRGSNEPLLELEASYNRDERPRP